jgi:hypothetical protein
MADTWSLSVSKVCVLILMICCCITFWSGWAVSAWQAAGSAKYAEAGSEWADQYPKWDKGLIASFWLFFSSGICTFLLLFVLLMLIWKGSIDCSAQGEFKERVQKARNF